MKQTVITTFLMFIGEDEIEVRAAGHYIKGKRGSRDAYGQPLEPDDDDEIQVEILTVGNKRVSVAEACEIFDMTQDEFVTRLEEELISALDGEVEAVF